MRRKARSTLDKLDLYDDVSVNDAVMLYHDNVQIKKKKYDIIEMNLMRNNKRESKQKDLNKTFNEIKKNEIQPAKPERTKSMFVDNEKQLMDMITNKIDHEITGIPQPEVDESLINSPRDSWYFKRDPENFFDSYSMTEKRMWGKRTYHQLSRFMDDQFNDIPVYKPNNQYEMDIYNPYVTEIPYFTEEEQKRINDLIAEMKRDTRDDDAKTIIIEDDEQSEEETRTKTLPKVRVKSHSDWIDPEMMRTIALQYPDSVRFDTSTTKWNSINIRNDVILNKPLIVTTLVISENSWIDTNVTAQTITCDIPNNSITFKCRDLRVGLIEVNTLICEQLLEGTIRCVHVECNSIASEVVLGNTVKDIIINGIRYTIEEFEIMRNGN